MSASDILGLVTSILLFAFGAIVFGFYIYSAVWAFRIRRALMSPLFKERARWVGIAAITFALLVSSNLLIRFFTPDNFYLGLLEYCVVDTAGIVMLVWIDITIKVARRSDPL